MEIKTTDEIIEEMKKSWDIVNSRQSQDYPNEVLNNAVEITKNNDKGWVSVNDLTKYINNKIGMVKERTGQTERIKKCIIYSLESIKKALLENKKKPTDK